MDERHYLTKEKYKELEEELNELKTVRRKEVARQLEDARSLGDLSENAEYHEARDQQVKIESRILQLENTLKNVEIVAHGKCSSVEVGCSVTVKNDAGDKIDYAIVGSEEADFSQNKISNQSPFGQAMMGKKKGDEFEFKTPKGKAKYKIVGLK